MSEMSTVLETMRSRRRKHDADLSGITQAQMNIETAFTYETMMTGGQGKITGAVIRNIFLRRPDHLDEHTIQIEGIVRNGFRLQQSQVQLIWAANQRARGDLLAALTGLTDNDLDQRTGLLEGEWTLREILEHLIVVERYYASDVLYGLERFHAGEPHGDLPSDEFPVERPGASFKELLLDLDSYRDTSLEALSDLTDTEIRAPARWDQVPVDVRFMLMRFAHHEREHTDQIYKLRAQQQRQQSEAERLLGLCWKQHGILEGHLVGVGDELLDHEPENGDWTIRRILDHISRSETYFRRVIMDSLQD